VEGGCPPLNIATANSLHIYSGSLTFPTLYKYGKVKDHPDLRLRPLQ